MQYLWIDDISEFRHVSEEWDAAVIRSGKGTPFLLSDFVVTWYKYFCNGLKLQIFVVCDGNKIIGGIPLYVERGGARQGWARTLRYIGGSAANYTEPLYGAPGIKVLELLKESIVKKEGWDVFYLPDVRGESELMIEHRGSGLDKRFLFYIIQNHMNWAIDLSAGKDSYLATVSKKLKRDLRTKRKQVVNNYGKMRLYEIKGCKGVEKYFDMYTSFSIQAFSGRSRNSTFENKGYANFFREFLVIMDKKQRLDAHVLFAGDKVLAISFGYKFGRGFNWVLTAFNYEYKYFRPGYLLIEELIDEIAKRHETYYNWYGHERFYKSQWCNQQTPLYRFFLMKRSAKGLFYKKLQQVKNGLRSNKLMANLGAKIKRS